MFKKSKNKLLKEEAIARLDIFQERYCGDKNGHSCRECILAFENNICSLNLIKYKFLRKKKK